MGVNARRDLVVIALIFDVLLKDGRRSAAAGYRANYPFPENRLPVKGCYPALYKGQLVKFDAELRVVQLKVWNGFDWIWVATHIQSKRYRHKVGKLLSPYLVVNDRRCHLTVQFKIKPPKWSSDVVCAVDVSIVGEVGKDNVLTMVDDIEAIAQQKALTVAHDENASAWIENLDRGIGNNAHPIKLVKLQKYLLRTLIELWLGALLGGFQLEQRGEFYDNETVCINQRGSD